MITMNRKLKPSRTGIIRDFDTKSGSVKLVILFVYLISAIIAVISLFPIVWVLLAGFKDLKEYMSSTSLLPQAFDFARYTKTWDQLSIVNNYLNSLYVITGSVICALIFCGLLAYGLSILKPVGHGILSKMILLSILIPATISLVPLYMNIQRINLGGTFIPLWLAAGANAIFVVLFKQFFESLPPSLIEAAQIDGCSQLRIFFKIVLPLSKPICAVVSIFAVNGAWSDFLLPYLVLGQGKLQTVMVRLFIFSTQQTINYDDLMRSVVFSMLPPIILFFIFQKQLTENAVSVGVKG